jgi:hypothetical protein
MNPTEATKCLRKISGPEATLEEVRGICPADGSLFVVFLNHERARILQWTKRFGGTFVEERPGVEGLTIYAPEQIRCVRPLGAIGTGEAVQVVLMELKRLTAHPAPVELKSELAALKATLPHTADGEAISLGKAMWHYDVFDESAYWQRYTVTGLSIEYIQGEGIDDPDSELWDTNPSALYARHPKTGEPAGGAK